MPKTPIEIFGFGEAMVELREVKPGVFHSFCAGDVFNALATARAHGIQAHFFSAIGRDFFFNSHLANLKKFRVDLDLIERQNHPNGVYFLKLNETGERTFQFFRKDSAPASLRVDDLKHLQFERFSALYTSAVASGISFSCREVVVKLISDFKALKKPIFYDLNYRAQLWDRKTAAQSFKALSESIDVLFLSGDERVLVEELFGIGQSDAEVAKQLGKLGPKIVVLRRGANGAVACVEGQIIDIPGHSVKSVDSTGAGDVFAGVFVAEYLQSTNVQSALEKANNAASQKVQKIGTLDFLLA